ncbi:MULTISPECIES: HEAT repeat domain-containing protein [Streptomyces]|uniref:HEAT repeat domain-containing protein n=1 Tax=Streptomyces TaxID=1883 RepID=UPI00068E2C20|nr:MULTISPECIES: HEAT repeat domain-containing protein [Streptomyces]
MDQVGHLIELFASIPDDSSVRRRRWLGRRLVDLFRSTPAGADIQGSSKVDVIVELEDHLDDARVLSFFVSVISDPAEYDLARIECIKILRLWPPDAAAGRQRVGRAMVAALQVGEDYLVRQWAARSLESYVGDTVVFEALATAVLHDGDPNVRDNALSSLQRAGRDDRSAELLRQLVSDPELGRAAARTLQSWA